MSDRYFLDESPRDDRAVLRDAEARHLVQIMRAKIGEVVTLFDGSGEEFVARIDNINKQAVEFSIVERKNVDREAAVRLTLAVALPKGDRQKWLVEKAVELGVARLIPLLTERGVAQPVENALDRLRRAVIEASKQCGRNQLLEIAEPCDLRALSEGTANLENGQPLRIIAHPGGEALAAFLAGANFNSAPQVFAAIGPEGGFTDNEVAAALNTGWKPVNLGPRILRVETAALAIAAQITLRNT